MGDVDPVASGAIFALAAGSTGGAANSRRRSSKRGSGKVRRSNKAATAAAATVAAASAPVVAAAPDADDVAAAPDATAPHPQLPAWALADAAGGVASDGGGGSSGNRAALATVAPPNGKKAARKTTKRRRRPRASAATAAVDTEENDVDAALAADPVFASLEASRRRALEEASQAAGRGSSKAKRAKAMIGEDWTVEELQLLSKARTAVPALAPDYWAEVAEYLNRSSPIERTATECQQIVYQLFDKPKPSTAKPRQRKRGDGVEKLGGKRTAKGVRQRRQFAEQAAEASDDDDWFTSQDTMSRVNIMLKLFPALLSKLEASATDDSTGAGAGAGVGSDGDVELELGASGQTVSVVFGKGQYLEGFGLSLSECTVASVTAVFVDGVSAASAARGIVQKDDLFVAVNDTSVLMRPLADVVTVLKDAKAGQGDIKLRFARVVTDDVDAAEFDRVKTPASDRVRAPRSRPSPAADPSPGQELQDLTSPGLLSRPANRNLSDALIARIKATKPAGGPAFTAPTTADGVMQGSPVRTTAAALPAVTAGGKVLTAELSPGGTARVHVRREDSDASSSSDEDEGDE